MASGLKIVSAKYGVGTNTLDVGSAVTGLIENGRLNFVVSAGALNVDDPAPGKPKTLTIVYTINGGGNNTKSAIDGDAVNIDAPPARTATGLQIVKAEYGYKGNFQDVTSALKTYLNDGTLSFTGGYSTYGVPDPNPQKKKELHLRVKINGEQSSYIVQDGEKFSLSAPAVLTDTSSPPASAAMSELGVILYDVVIFGWLFFLISVTIESYNYGRDNLFSGAGWILGFLGFVSLGFFPIFILPFLVFWWYVLFGK